MEKNALTQKKKKAAEKFRQLANTNYTEKELKVEIAYDICLSKTDTSLFTVNK